MAFTMSSMNPVGCHKQADSRVDGFHIASVSSFLPISSTTKYPGSLSESSSSSFGLRAGIHDIHTDTECELWHPMDRTGDFASFVDNAHF